MKKNKRGVISIIMICIFAGLIAFVQKNSDDHAAMEVVLATGSDASHSSIGDAGGSTKPAKPEKGTESENGTTKEEKVTVGKEKDPENSIQKAPEIAEAEQEIELEEARKTYTEKQLQPERGFYIYQVQAAKPYYRVFFTFHNAQNDASDVQLNVSENYIEGAHGPGNILKPADSGIKTDQLKNLNAYIQKNYTIILDVSAEIEESVFDNAKEDIISFIQESSTEESFTLYTNAYPEAGADYRFTDADIRQEKGVGVDKSILEEIRNIEQTAETVDLETVYNQVLNDRFVYNQQFVDNNPPGYLRIALVVTDKDSVKTEEILCDNYLQNGIFIADIAGGVKNDLNALQSYLRDIYVVDLIGSSNQADETEQELLLYLYDDDKKQKYLYQPFKIQISQRIVDSEVPEIESVSYYQEKNEIWIRFSEPVIHAGEKEHYSLMNKETEEKIEFTGLQTGNDAGSIYILSLPDDVAKGEYEITVIGETESGVITDISVEHNRFADETKTISIDKTEAEENTDESEKTAEKFNIKKLVIIAAAFVVLFAAIAIIIIAVHKKRRRREQQKQYVPDPKRELKKSDVSNESAGKPVTLVMLKEGKIIREQNVKINGSLIVGRADTSDIEVDEPGMSRQHFVIEYDGESFYIQDLDTTNGTKLNGVKITHKRRLEKNDHIKIAGLDIIVRW